MTGKLFPSHDRCFPVTIMILGANWSIGSGKATYTSGASNALTRDTDITLVAGYYLVKFDFVTSDSVTDI